MKTILLLHREELTYLYILISKYLLGKMNIVHVAYSDKEATILCDAGIFDYINYCECTDILFDSEKKDDITLNQIDKFFIENTNGRFNLNTAIQSDRGFSILSYNEALLSAQVHYKCWKEIFAMYKIDFMLHESCSLFFNHIGAVMCREQGGNYIWNSATRSDKGEYCYLNHNYDDYTNVEIESNFKYYIKNSGNVDIERCRNFVEKFRTDYNMFFCDVLTINASVFNLWFHRLKEKINIFKNATKYDRVKRNIDYWMSITPFWNDKCRNFRDYKRDKILFEQMPQGEKYFYYSFHLEPEAVVLYLGDGIYMNQIKLIENIAASLPVGYFLYVKDHPYELAYRKSDDYRRLQQIPNIRLLNQSIAGKKVIKDAVGVFSINGTAGFEALLLGKQVYNFGWSYYCYNPRVNYIRNIRDLQRIVYRNLDIKYEDDITFYSFVNAYLDATHVGFITYFGGMADKYCCDQNANAKQIAEDFIKYCERF